MTIPVLPPTAPGVFPLTFDTVEVRGRYVDIGGAPVVGRLEFTPSRRTLVVSGEKVVVVGKTLQVNLVNGAFSIRLPATNDPDVNDGPGFFFYRTEEIFVGLEGRSFGLSVPLERKSTGIDITDVGPYPEADLGENEASDEFLDGGGAATTDYDNEVDGGGAITAP